VIEMAESLRNRVAVVTGANRGIGKAVVRALAEAGAEVVLAVRDPASGQDARDEIAAATGARLEVLECDVADRASVDRFRKRLVKAHPAGVHVLVNNAGILEDREETSLTIPIEVFQRHLDVNVTGALRVSQAVVPLLLRAGWGRVVNLSSTMGQFEGGLDGGYTGYRVSKAALNALTKTMAADLRDTPVLVNSVHPGWVRTRMTTEGAPETPERAAETVLHLATLPSGGPSGRFWRRKRQIAW
jgi:NAD(P)-dependent dehydrogenase (short-subunit alcohol dehydrogenase family)